MGYFTGLDFALRDLLRLVGLFKGFWTLGLAPRLLSDLATCAWGEAGSGTSAACFGELDFGTSRSEFLVPTSGGPA